MLNAWTSYPVCWLGCVWTGSWGDSELPSWGTVAFPAWLCRGNRSGTNRAAWATEPNVRIVYPERRSMIICCAGSSVSSLQCCLSVFLQTTAKGSRRKQRRLTFPLRRRSHTFALSLPLFKLCCQKAPVPALLPVSALKLKPMGSERSGWIKCLTWGSLSSSPSGLCLGTAAFLSASQTEKKNNSSSLVRDLMRFTVFINSDKLVILPLLPLKMASKFLHFLLKWLYFTFLLI